MARSTILNRNLVNTQVAAPGSYNNSSSGLTSTSVQGAVDEVEGRVDGLEAGSHDALTLDSDLDTTSQAATLVGQELELKKATPSTDGVMSSEDKTKIDGIEANATADQTGAEIKALYEAEADTNAFTDAEQTKLAGIEVGATADQIAADVPYTNTTSGLTAVNLQAAVDEVDGRIDTLEGSSHAAVTLSSATDVTGQAVNLVGQEIELLKATTSTDGLLSSEDKLKIDGIELNAKDDQDADEVPVAFVATSYTAATPDVEAHIVGIHAKIVQIDQDLVGGVTYKGGYNAAVDYPSLDGEQVTLTGTAALDDTVNVVGTGTAFTTEIAVGDTITIAGENRSVATIVSDTSLTVTVAFTAGTTSGEVIQKTGTIIAGIQIGDMYTVTADGDFFGEAKTVGDVVIAEANDPTALSHWTRVENNLEDAADIAYDNIASGLIANNVQTAIDEVEARVDALETAANTQPQTVNRETIIANKTLTNTDDVYQHIITSTASLLVNLPPSPVNGTHFVIKNNPTSSESFTSNSVIVGPGDIYDVIYDGTEWVVI